jgi:hypothetical protein
MELRLVNPDARYSKVRLIEPAPLGYLHVAAAVQALKRPGPVLLSRERSQLVGALKVLGRQLEQVPGVQRVTVYKAIAFGCRAHTCGSARASSNQPALTSSFSRRRTRPI